MRHMIVLSALVPMLLGACSRDDDTNAAGFKPPINILRTDLIAGFDRRFDRLDRNRNGTVELSEVTPERLARTRRLDTDNDGKITRDEYKSAQLAHFDRTDANHDGTLTTPERDAAKLLNR
ncbi:hypothetical protein [Sphingomonas alpina]|uniref:EF-hand domain-containing protein n=1 Tax=Sphingomonas alpina TaxID=653931 RepID=A0A7H0LGZ6_9SPHN|nr:hypothetical protein [Sphingomonas alpina]QNQ08949.1 hypothetical protein H3Z74_19955 [Sphingomonas alpina]